MSDYAKNLSDELMRQSDIIRESMSLESVVIVAVDRREEVSTAIFGESGCVYASMGAMRQWLQYRLEQAEEADELDALIKEAKELIADPESGLMYWFVEKVAKLKA